MRILYLANYAPLPHLPPVDVESAEVYHQLYHQEIYHVLNSLGLEVVASRSFDDLLTGAISADYVFSLLNRTGARGSEMLVSTVCEHRRTPYLGAPPDIRAIADDKYVSKLVASHIGVEVPPGYLLRANATPPSDPPFAGPFFVKSRSGAASLYVEAESVQDGWEDALKRADVLRLEGEDVLIETYVSGDDVSIGVIGGPEPVVLNGSRVISTAAHGIVTRAQKQAVEIDFRREPVTDSAIHGLLQDWATKLFAVTQPLDYARYDFRVPADGTSPRFLEFNVCCSIGSDTGFAASALEHGLSHTEFVAAILRHSFTRQGLQCDGF